MQSAISPVDSGDSTDCNDWCTALPTEMVHDGLDNDCDGDADDADPDTDPTTMDTFMKMPMQWICAVPVLSWPVRPP